MARSELTDIPGHEVPRGTELASVAGALDVDEDGAGLRATVTFEHRGDGPVSLLNPFELLQWQLLDERGAPIAVPARPPNVFRPSPPEAWLEEGPLRPVAARRDGAELAVAELGVRTLELQPGTDVAEALDVSKHVPLKIVFKALLTTPDEITQLCLDANADPQCAGLVLWMHTFSPSKMWIGRVSTHSVALSPSLIWVAASRRATT